MKIKLAEIRREYTKDKLVCRQHADNPFELFETWLKEAVEAGEEEPTAMIVATVSSEGHPSARTVLLKGLDDHQFIFFTNYESRKGKQMAGNPYVSLSFVWHKLERQVHIEGQVTKCNPNYSDTYFASRPYKSKIGAIISPQSQVITGRMELMRTFVQESLRGMDQDLKRPDHWGGLAVTPSRFEFWQGRENRLHDRIQYTLNENKQWEKERLAP